MLPDTVLFVTVSVPLLKTPPPSPPVLSDTVLFVTVSVPLLSMPPPTPPVSAFSIVKLFNRDGPTGDGQH